MLLTIDEMVSSEGSTSLFAPLVIFLVTVLVASPIILHVTFLVIFPDHNLCQSQSHLLCPHPFHLPYHVPGHLSGHILNQYPFHFLLIFPVIFPFLIFVISFPET